MTTYEYRCAVHGSFDSNARRDWIYCHIPYCNQEARRQWSVNRKSAGREHFNFSLGQYVKSDRDFDEKLKIAGEEAGTTFSRLDPGDAPRPTSDDHIFDTQLRTLTDKGFVGSDGKVTIDDKGHYVPK